MQIKLIEGVDSLRIRLSGVNVDLEVHGTIYALWLIPLKTSHLTLKNVDVQVDLSIDAQDQVHW